MYRLWLFVESAEHHLPPPPPPFPCYYVVRKLQQMLGEMELVPSVCGNHRSLLPVPLPHLSVRLPLILPPCPFMANTEYSLQHHPVSAPARPPFSAPASPLQSADKEHSVQMDSSLSHSRCDRRPEHVPSPVVMFASIWYAKKLGRRLVQNSRRAKLLKDKVSLPGLAKQANIPISEQKGGLLLWQHIRVTWI